jgi:hypothetical protein
MASVSSSLRLTFAASAEPPGILDTRIKLCQVIVERDNSSLIVCATLVLAHLNDTIINVPGQLLRPLRLHSTRHLHAPASATQRSPAVSLREVITSARMRGCGDRKQHDGVTGDGLLWNVRSGEWNLPTVQQSALVTGGRRNGVQCFDGFLHCLALAVLQPLQTPQNRISGFLVRCKLLVCQSLDEPFRQSHMLENIPKIEGRFPRHTATTSEFDDFFQFGPDVFTRDEIHLHSQEFQKHDLCACQVEKRGLLVKFRQ